jgi:hypothetical protein
MVMNKRELAPGIVVYADAIKGYETLPKDIEEGILSAGLSWQKSAVRAEYEAKVDTTLRDTEILGVEYKDHIVENFNNTQEAFFGTLSNMFFESLTPLEKDYRHQYGFDTSWHDQYGLLKYGEGQKFTNHIDDHPEHHRRMSTVYYMNDDYTGGEILFPRFGLSYKPKANDFIVFPSTYVYNHSVTPVEKGTRYAVVSWLK